MMTQESYKESRKHFCQIRQLTVQNTASYVKKLINQIDEELELFGFGLLENGVRRLHLIAQT